MTCRWHLGKKLGAGMYGDVYLTDNHDRVVKMHRSGLVPIDEIVNEHNVTRIASNLAIGPSLYESCIYYDAVGGYLVLERLYSLDDDDEDYDHPNSKLGEKLLDKIALLHSEGITHGDLRPDNILFNRNKTDVYIVDYGTAIFPKTVGEGIYRTFKDYMMLEKVFGEMDWDDRRLREIISLLAPSVPKEYHESDEWEALQY